MITFSEGVEVCTSQVGNKLSISSIKISPFHVFIRFFDVFTIFNVCIFKNGADKPLMTVLVRVSLGTSVCNMEHGVN